MDRYLRPVLDPTPLACWAGEQAYTVLDACPTNYMVRKVRRTLSAVLGVGVANGFLRTDQRDLHKVAVPLRPELRPPRHPRAWPPDGTALLWPDQVPSLDQVRRLADADPPGIAHELWTGAVNTLAYLGVRVGELFAFAADDVLDDLPPGLVAVRWQLIEPRGRPKRLAPPKNGFGRLAAVCETTPLGFPLREWLTARAEEARSEQACGQNPAAVLFVTPSGCWWTRSNFRQRCFNPGGLLGRLGAAGLARAGQTGRGRAPPDAASGAARLAPSAACAPAPLRVHRPGRLGLDRGRAVPERRMGRPGIRPLGLLRQQR